ncbi:LuxR C-terminal-related transcriptional regulator [Arthrobacter sp. B1805]|uniref:LuxR C-terminal-related transcriptional regulator n=1 Tax=Arthrobacter sp. B1805 TaxID=2058892 RepID=UPI000CE4DBAD|nr:LuxR C-terminal-related transcriptional regulator [Arthrobacter sp. B1805]
MSRKRTDDGQPEGREVFLARLVDELREASVLGVVVMGEAGAGKTTVAREVEGRSGPGAGILRISGRAVLSQVPFGGLSTYLRGMPAEALTQPAAVMRRFVYHLSGSGAPADTLPLLLIDDAHDLDEDTVALLVQLIAGRKARALILACPLPGLPQGFEELVADGLLGAVVMEPLTAEEVGEVCSSLLGGPVVSAVVHIAAHITGGNPRFLQSFINEGVASGYLRERNGVWHAASELPPVSARLTDLVQAVLAPLSQEERDAMTLLALAEPATGNVAHTLVDQDVLRTLLDVSLVRMTADGLLVLRHPLYGAVLRGVLPTARRMGLERRVLAAMTAPPRDDDEVLQRAALALDAGVAMDDDALLSAAAAANRLHDRRAALRVLDAVGSPRLRRRRLVEMAWAESTNDVGVALELVEEALAPGTEQPALRDAIILSLILMERGACSTQDMHAAADRWQHLLDGASEDGSPSTERENALLMTVVRHAVRRSGDTGVLEPEAVRTIAADDTVARQTRIVAFLVLTVDLLGRGLPAEAATMAAGALELVTTDADTLPLLDLAAGLRIIALLAAGEAEQALSAFHSFYRRDPRSIFHCAVWEDVIEGTRALEEGRFSAARSRLLLASEALQTSDLLLILPWVRGLASYAALLAGDPESAEALLEFKDGARPAGSRLARSLAEVYTQSVTAALSGDPDGAATLVLLADAASGEGLPIVAAAALDQALVLGDRSVLPRLADLTASFDGRKQRLVHTYARAAAGEAAGTSPQDNGHRLLEIGEAAVASGYRPLAARCFEQARETFEQREDNAGVRLALQRLAACTGGMDRPQGAHGIVLPAGVRLTPRESAVVKLAVKGLTNREIAERHGTSVRTVEGHLYRIFAKSGISRREDLLPLMSED